MRKEKINIKDHDYPVISLNTLVIGSGAAGLNAAIQLFERGVGDIAIVTEGIGFGTSNNAGSDKQTYYKLSLDSQTSDTALEMARDLSAGGCMHGDIALCEAQYSVPAFYNLVRLGVPFPHDTYGSYPGFLTDHDNKGRGTSAGPLTSGFMVSALLKEVRRRGITIFDRQQVISLLVSDNEGTKEARGAIAFNPYNAGNGNGPFVIYNAVNIILATGGPGDLYKYSVYPESQKSSIGMALRAGAVAQNLTESQFGIASLDPGWNLSGSYQQVIPRYFSTDRNLKGERDFLDDFFPDTPSLCRAIFLKGYQWPFDPMKVIDNGSSLIDLLVYREINQLGRRVFIDYRRNPGMSVVDFKTDNLPEEPLEYLWKSGALQDTPYKRLLHLNSPAVDLFLGKGKDLGKEPLEIAVCAQHNNGGLKADIWWESNIRHLFPVGEICGAHGVYRPGGSALNSGQVGGFRAAERISSQYNINCPDTESFLTDNKDTIVRETGLAADLSGKWKISPYGIIDEIRSAMSKYGGHIRNPEIIDRAVEEARESFKKIQVDEKSDPEHAGLAIRVYDLAIARLVYLESIKEMLGKGIGSRGSFLVMDEEGERIHGLLEEEWKIKINNPSDHDKLIQETWMDDDMKVKCRWVKPEPVPDEKHWFETLWKEYRSKA